MTMERSQLKSSKLPLRSTSEIRHSHVTYALASAEAYSVLFIDIINDPIILFKFYNILFIFGHSLHSNFFYFS